MGKSQFETLNHSATPIPFHTRRRSHLKSETFRTLVRILTHPYDDSHRYLAAHIVPEMLILNDGGSEVGKATRIELLNGIAGSHTPKDLDDVIRKDTVANEGTEVTGNEVQTVNNELENPTSIGCEEPDKDNSTNLSDTSAGRNQSGTGIIASNHSRGSSQVQMINNELENPMSIGYEEPVKDNSVNLLDSSVSKNLIGNGVIDEEESFLALQNFLMEESGNAEEELADSGHYSFDAYKAFKSSLEKDIVSAVSLPGKNNTDESSSLEPASLKPVSLEKDVVSEVSVAGKNNEKKTSFLKLMSLENDVINDVSAQGKNGNDKTSSLELNALEEVEHVTWHSDMGLEKSFCTSTAKNTPPHRTAVEEIEEGEISDECQSYDHSSDLFPESSVTLDEKKVGDDQISKDMVNEKVIYKEQNEANKKDISSSYNADIVDNAGNGIEVKVSNSNVMECKSTAVSKIIVKDKKADNRFSQAGRTKNQDDRAKEGVNLSIAYLDGVREISEENANENRGITFPEKEVVVCKKKERGGNEENKKIKKGMKRAEKNRELGVKRLKLQPVLRPQVKRICGHFLKGKCRKGAECNFSHDTVPLTKSMPCAYYAHNKQCMKGDDCPFDHELSKHPCRNYEFTGYCNRGDKCLFSHKVPLKAHSSASPTVCISDSKSLPLPGNSDSKKHSKQSTAETLLKAPAQPPKGISFYSFGKSKSPSDVSTKVKQPDSSPKGVNLKEVNQMNLNASNETLKKTPHARVLQGKNLLLFGESSKKQAQSLNMDQVIGKSSEPKQASTSPLPGPSSLGIHSLLQNASAMTHNFPGSLLSGGQSSGQLSDGRKSTPSSIQKPLLTSSLQKVLAFAGRYESNMKKDSVAGTSGSSQMDSSKTLSLFDSLYGGGGG